MATAAPEEVAEGTEEPKKKKPIVKIVIGPRQSRF